MKTTINFFLLGITLLFISCDTGSRMEKKMLSRLSANEIESASGYIYPGDQTAFAFFVKEVIPCCDNVYFEADNIDSQGSGDHEILIVDYKIRNYNTAIINYFRSIGKNISNEGIMRDTIRVIKTKDGKKIAFTWGIPNIDNENLRWATLPKNKNESNAIVRVAPDKKSKALFQMKQGQNLVYDQQSSYNGWVHVFWVSQDGYCNHGYIMKDSLSLTKHKTYSPSIFDSFIFLLIATIVGILIVVFLLPILIEFGSCIGVIAAAGTVIGVLYVAYEFVEKVLFELFIINLPH